MDQLKTGDILLFTSQSNTFLGYFTSLIKWATHSNITHMGMILKDPDFLNPPLKGIYVWQSGYDGKPDSEDGKIKLGVQITPLKNIINDYKNIGHIFLRQINTNQNNFNNQILREIHTVVHNKPYDLVLSDWIKVVLGHNKHQQRVDRFWCSALVGYIYTKCGILKPDTDWTMLRPCDFCITSENLNYIHNNSLDNTEIKLN